MSMGRRWFCIFLLMPILTGLVFLTPGCRSEETPPQAVSKVESGSSSGAASGSDPQEAKADPPLVESGTFTAKGVRLSFIGSGVAWNGVLHYEGGTRNFRVTGLGVGGIGVSVDKVSGTVYNMKSIEDFVGAYGNVRAGITIGTTLRDKHVWAENENGVRIKMKSDNKGLQLNLGADALVVTWRGAD